MDTSTAAAELRQRQDSKELVRITRRWSDDDYIEGYVSAVDERWAAIAVLDDKIFLDGYALIRLEDIVEVEVKGGLDAFATRSLMLNAAWPPPPLKGVDLHSARKILTSGARRFPLVTLYQEEEDADVCFIGRVVGFDQEAVGLLEINSKARWAEDATRWLLDAVTRLDLGGVYEQRLLQVANSETPPER